ncbi:hypothetical protein HMI54_012304 [Coelomomyces lativittatus]|nr:hypothetical protein HMI54_012304 [Coelomomyces lativittatus]
MTYSHHAYALLSPLIQNLNEQSFEEYMQEKVLTPLDMHHSTFQTHDLNDPVMKMYMQKEHDEKSSNTYKNVASGFVKKASGSFKSVGDLYVNAIPAAGLATTATDMAKFLKMILGEGKHKKRILSSKSVKLMLSRQFSVHDAVDGSGYGWVERHFTNNVRVLLHGGDLPGFSSLAFMIPNEKIGCFIAMNANDQHLRSTFLSEFVNKFSDSKSNSDTESIYRQELSSSFSFEGNYRPMRSAYTSFESIQSILGQVKITKQGSNLFLSASPSGFGYFYEFNYELIPQSQDVFKVSTGKPHPQDEIKVAFIRGNDAHPPMLVTNALSDMPLTFQSISFFSSYTFLLASWCVCLFLESIWLFQLLHD